jgi:hypothetical protein
MLQLRDALFVHVQERSLVLRIGDKHHATDGFLAKSLILRLPLATSIPRGMVVLVG